MAKHPYGDESGAIAGSYPSNGKRRDGGSAMTSVIWHTMMSLDGFIAGPDDTMDWAFRHGGRSALADETRDSIGAILAGRRWYDVASARYDGVAGIYGGAWTGPVFVLTHRPDDAPDDSTVTFLSEGIEEAVATASAAADGRAVNVFGANTAGQIVRAGLLDEIVVHIAPVLLGDGVRFYGAPGTAPVELERVEGGDSEQVIEARYRVRRPED
jgi:dihydrofolate reductase